MKKFITLLTLMVCWSVQADADKIWYKHKEIPLPEVTQSRLNTKLKLLELVSLRQWNIVGQTSDSFDMSLKNCNLKISFTDKSIVISHDRFQKNNNSSTSKKPECSRNWLSNVAKDINATLTIMSVQQEAINLEEVVQ
ncbi:hypothetical protein BCS96_04335 [Vibrio breoganii]|uniref:hypothetical protein n=1 Tax=Vibrio breoganii TaxID=553239 RepID=UPI000C833F87|nr:hypothetical protein [Vibrio breoganii]PMG34243.1 hypothetical protein BCU93_18520 [Vibrio breoganii]PMG82088.1 hypothetical protein BCU81_16770 [Vibrio breoganii]PMG93261.1 hypothetical protein BCU80_08495 [Vibrio breoganii]PML82607.1 hypothetical protein BCT68_12060 [Vibrio breoganii]PMM50175.1 hypothetical protein BCT52_02800 [Vibrio breoganii]